MSKLFKRVVVWKHNNIFTLCHTLCGLLNPFKDFDTEDEARKYADNNELTCDDAIFTGSLSEWNN